MTQLEVASCSNRDDMTPAPRMQRRPREEVLTKLYIQTINKECQILEATTMINWLTHCEKRSTTVGNQRIQVSLLNDKLATL